MSKLSRSVLKQIVKECIVEVFEESFFPGSVNNISNSQMNERLESSSKSTRNKRPQKAQHQKRRSHYDSISYGSSNSENKSSKNHRFDERVNEVTSKLTSDPVMSSIFKDTAATTLQEQMSGESNRSNAMPAGDQAARIVNSASPEDIFGDAAGKWAQLAFADPINK
tara:strand:- start:70 stop:570 length:501 start_codon:yes stop_codon:yes gene_type:complete